MLLVKRPPEPVNFAKSMTRCRNAVQLHIDTLFKAPATPVAPSPAALPKARKKSTEKKKKKDVFSPKWSAFKDEFSKVQYGKCAYCEVSVIGAQHGDVEHYYPKGQIQALHDDPGTWGRERPYLSNVEGRSPRILSETGYWWLAYEWSNYLLSCMVCNEYWKGAIFPVEDDPRRLPPTSDVSEIALLLNPFDDVNPAEHIHFDSFGQIHSASNSLRGFETIRTCGLDRPSLRGFRAGIAREAYYLANKLSKADTPSQIKDILYSLYLKGVETNHHPGMVRVIIERRCGLIWPELVDQLARLLTTDLLDATDPDVVREALLALYEMGRDSRENSELVHAIVVQHAKESWETLVEQLISTLTKVFKADDEGASASALELLHQMGSINNPHSPAIRSLIQHECGLSWDELEVEIGLAGNRRRL